MSVRVITWVWDHSMSEGTDRLVLLALADSADDNGSCWPSVLTLARKTRVSERTVRRSIRTLEALGELHTVLGSGTTSNRYRIMLDPRVQVVRSDPGQSDPPVNLTPGQSDRGGQSDPTINTDNIPQVSPVNLTGADTGDRGTVKNDFKSKKTRSGEPIPTSTADERFTEFWDACPRKVKKAEAFRKYQATIRAGASSAALLEGMRRYALSVRDSDPQYIAHPSTWLHQGRWEDEPVRPGQSRKAATEW